MTRASYKAGRPSCAARRCAALLLGAAATGAAIGAQDAAPPLQWVATAQQMGPVAYRDPLGALSPDGRWLAFTERDRIHVQPVTAAGPVRILGTGLRSLRAMAWLPDSRRLAVRERLFDRSGSDWFLYDRVTGRRAPLWPDRDGPQPSMSDVSELTWSAEGRIAALESRGGDAVRIYEMDGDGRTVSVLAEGSGLAFAAWHPDGRLACITPDGRRARRLQLPCGDQTSAPLAGRTAYGPVAFSPDGGRAYYASPDEDGFLDLWTEPLAGGDATRLSRFSRDAYAPTADATGKVLFKVQDYRVTIASVPASGGEPEPLTTFQSETPTWSPDGGRIALTFGSWRHVTDDLLYPDIAQHLGIVNVGSGPAAAPHRVVRRSPSEDQSLSWSPNGRWIAFHTHLGSDDIWLMPADGSSAARMISVDGRETGWPRWSPDGRLVSFTSYRRGSDGGRQAFIYLIGVDQQSGAVREAQTRLDWGDFPYDAIHAEWAGNAETLIFEAAEGPGRKGLYTVARSGGTPQKFHQFASDQIHSGIGVSPDGSRVAYVAPDAGGFFQIWSVPSGGGAARRVTRGPSHKTQPAFSPDGRRIAFTLWDYTAQFWITAPPG